MITTLLFVTTPAISHASTETSLIRACSPVIGFPPHMDWKQKVLYKDDAVKVTPEFAILQKYSMPRFCPSHIHVAAIAQVRAILPNEIKLLKSPMEKGE